MKPETNKYIAAIIIVLGVLFIYFIPNIFKKQVEPTGDFKQLYENSRFVILVDKIHLSEELKMSGVITSIVNNDNNEKVPHQIGDNIEVGEIRKFVNECPVTPPDAAILFINSIYGGKIQPTSKWYFNDRKLQNGLTYQEVLELMQAK